MKKSLQEEADNTLLKRCLCYDYEEVTHEQKVVNGKLVDTVKTEKKHVPPSVLAIMHYLCTKAPDKWRPIDLPEDLKDISDEQ